MPETGRGPAASLRFVTGAWAGREIPIPEPEARIGRNDDLDIVIPPEDRRYVSRVHAVIRFDRGAYTVEDQGSTNGTLVNGTRIERAALADGDEIQFGRHGPLARFRFNIPSDVTGLAPPDLLAPAAPAMPAAPVSDPGRVPVPEPEPVRAAERARARASGSPPSRAAGGGSAPAAGVPQPPDPSAGERPSQMVRRIVSDALAAKSRRARGRVVFLAVSSMVVLGAAIGGTYRLGFWEGEEDRLHRIAESYTDRVVLVETGYMIRGQYYRMSNGSGFVASEDGLIVTNKHVVYPHLYSPDDACLAEAFRRSRLNFEDHLVITVWQGGKQFRQNPASSAGDRGLGFSTEHGTLRLVALASDNLVSPVDIQCSGFVMRWRPHASDNNDLAVLRASARLPAIPLAEREPRSRDHVLVFGFPRGVGPLETNEAVPLARAGRVLRVQDTIQIDAVVLHGNSGGPLIDANGHVVGITTRGPAETLNMAIKVEYARRLLDRARQTTGR